MRLFIQWLGELSDPSKTIPTLKILHHLCKQSNIFCIQIRRQQNQQSIVSLVCQRLTLKSQQVLVKAIKIGKLKQRCIRITPSMTFVQYVQLMGDDTNNFDDYQMLLNLTPLDDTQIFTNQINTQNQQNSETIQSQCQTYNNQLFKALHCDDRIMLRNNIQKFIQVKQFQKIKTILNLYHKETGYALLHAAIFYKKHIFLKELVQNYGTYINQNMRSVDGWLPFNLAVSIKNYQAINILINSSTLELNLNYQSSRGPIIFDLLDSSQLQIIKSVVEKIPIFFQLSKNGKNVYDYIQDSKLYTQNQKKELIMLMHQKHLDFYDYYRDDKLLLFSCRKYMPKATLSYSPKKSIIQSNNFKITSGDIIKCRSPPLFAKLVYLSVNSYIGAIQQYEISSKINVTTDQEKLNKYNKTYHYSLQQIQQVRMLQPNQRSWSMKKNMFYFMFMQKRGHRTVMACHQETTAHKWISQIMQAKYAWENVQHQQNQHKLLKNYFHIYDEAAAKTEGAKRIEAMSVEDLMKKLSFVESSEESSSPLLNKSQSQNNSVSINSLNNLSKQKNSSDIKLTKCQSSTQTRQDSTASTQLLTSSLSQSKITRLKYSDFKMLQMLGEGSFGQVFLVQCLINHKYYALKTFLKKKIILSKQTKFVIAEVNILKQIQNPYIISLHFTFQTPHYIYLGLEYCPGRDLSRHLQVQVNFSEDDTRLYAAEIVLALQSLHAMGIIYRDLKPQNIMIGKDGHILLVDFGLSKKTENNFAKTFCGSPAYLSPQMLDRKGVGPETDFFSLGVVIYELLFGQPPFYSQNIHLLYDNILHSDVTFPSKINPTTKSLIQGLLKKQPKQRLGSNSIDQLKNHPYFKSIDWQKLMKKQIPSPRRKLKDDESDIQSEEELINMVHEDFDYSPENMTVNRFKNYSFIKENQFDQ